MEKAGPAVANISTERLVARRDTDPFFSGRSELFREYYEDYFGTYEKEKIAVPLGSGVIIDPEGYIVTNEHVTSVASKLMVSLSDGSQYEAQVISSDPEMDLAVMKVEAGKPLPYVHLGTSRDLMIGETVVALGNPLGQDNLEDSLDVLFPAHKHGLSLFVQRLRFAVQQEDAIVELIHD
ncbi:MAG TPA: trypsin-like peptidase domain-containing protein, partial [Candidatus Tripitaka californicus]|uniref:trypsin-like peptidase domain-containing protein n=1 Tax=Candidatus Tripitaka californicus TaxID=3367616 RepID=UPI0040297225